MDLSSAPPKLICLFSSQKKQQNKSNYTHPCSQGINETKIETLYSLSHTYTQKKQYSIRSKVVQCNNSHTLNSLVILLICPV